MYDNKYILGLDIGISSVGWGMLELDNNNLPYRIIDLGSRIFTPGEVEKTGDSRAKERREKRGARRVTRRREFRVARVKNLLYENKFLLGNIDTNIVSEKNNQLNTLYNEAINEYYKLNITNPYKLKVEALNRKLTDIELCIILVHYAKKRGYKSNREEASDNESGKVLSAIKENETLIKNNNYRTISEMYLKDEKFKNKIKNSPGDYKVSVTNEMYLDEINKVLNKQIEFGLINEQFKNDYLEIYNSRRNYSKGPGGDSPYGGDLIAKMTGKCKFDNEPRAPKKAPSSEIFVSLTKLINLRYKDEEGTYISLTEDEIKEMLSKAKEKNEVKYDDLVKILNKKNIKFKDLQLSKKEYETVTKETKNKLNLSQESRIDISSLEEEDKEVYNKIYQKKLYSKPLIKLEGYHALRQVITKCFGKDNWEQVKDNIILLDELALYCTNYKLDEDIKNKIKESDLFDDKYLEEDFIKSLPNMKDHLMLSTSIIRKLIPIMSTGVRYDEAMKEIGYISYDTNSTKEKKDLLVPIMVDDNITNQRVIRSLTQSRKVINAIIKKYGKPKIINIETARELAKTRQERNEIKKRQELNKAENDKIKQQLVELGLFDSIDRISSTDLLKYKLWKEQREFCGYSLQKIAIEDLYNNNTTQIDHILPYSRTFNDNYLNKTLVLTKENQDKGNKTPYEWFGNTKKWEEYESFINSLNISPSKKDNYLLKKLDEDMEREMREQNLNDTKYISKELASLIKSYLNVEKVNVYQGALTAKLRARWGFNRLTHSYISKTYIMPKEMKSNIKKDRDNHLHHALDALVIASITPSLQQKITLYEKFSRYIDGETKTQLNNMDFESVENQEFYNAKTGEIYDVKFKQYLREETLKNHIYFSKHNIAKLSFPLPYENFAEEAKIRVYERDLQTMLWELKALNTYTEDNLKNAKVLMPSIKKAKVSGKMHDETYYGIKKIGETTYKTVKKPLSNIKKKDLENIPDKNGGSKDIYNAIMNWFGDYEKGEEALKKNNGKYPINPNDKEQKEIKKIKIYSEYKNNGHIVNGANVEKGGIYKIGIYKSKDKEDDKLYFAGYDILEIKKINSITKGKEADFPVKLSYGLRNNNIVTTYKNLLENYTQIDYLSKNDLVQVKLKDGRESIAYVVGFSSGMFEVKSIIGDGYDIIGNNNIFGKKIERYQITISTIETIKKLSINILGEISGL